jgi:quercetin dioxygenase-like cupin family protein
MRRLCLSLAVACLLPAIAWAEEARKPVTVTPLATASTTASGQPIALPTGPVTVSVSRYVIEPGAKLPVHKHPNQRYAYVQAGNLAVYDVDTGQRFDYKPGDLIVEVLDQWHYGENTGAVPVELLVIDQTPAGTTVNTVVKP